MKKKSLILFILVVVISSSFFACKSTKNTIKVKDEVEIAKFQDISMYTDSTIILDSNFLINEAEIIGDSLILTITYQGGCIVPEFNIYWDGTFMRSMPPKTNLYVSFGDKVDKCKKMCVVKRYYNLSELKKRGEKEIILYLNGDFKGALRYFPNK